MKKAFTLIELLVVIAIIGVLAASVLVSVVGAKPKSVDAALARNLSEIQKTISQCIANDGTPNIANNTTPSGNICSNASPPVSGEFPTDPAGTTAKGTSNSPWTWDASQSQAFNPSTGTFQFGAKSGNFIYTCHQNGCDKKNW